MRDGDGDMMIAVRDDDMVRMRDDEGEGDR